MLKKNNKNIPLYEYEIAGVVAVNIEHEEFMDLFIDFIESIGGSFGGAFYDHETTLKRALK